MSFCRAMIFHIKGLSEYTQAGFESASKRFNLYDTDVDMSDQHIMITGANSGIGKITALECAKRQSHVYMVCRDEKRGKEAQEEIIRESNNRNIELYLCDISKPQDVVIFTKQFIQLQKPLNVLCNNAGCMINERQLINDEHEVNFATNTLGIYILTKNLIPILTQNQLARVFTTSSADMYNVKLDPDNFNLTHTRTFDGNFVYAQNKRQQVVMAERLAERYPSVYFATWHPGWVDTPLVRSAMPTFYAKMQNRLRIPEQGADTLIWLCCQKDIAEKYKNGDFFQDRTVISKHLPLAWTKSTIEEDERFMRNLDRVYEKYVQ